jgi:hypothetical protein
MDGWMDGWMLFGDVDVVLVDRLLVGKPQHRVKVVYHAGVAVGSVKSGAGCFQGYCLVVLQANQWVSRARRPAQDIQEASRHQLNTSPNAADPKADEAKRTGDCFVFGWME